MSATRKPITKTTKSAAPASQTAKSPAKKTPVAAAPAATAPAELTPAVVTKLVAAVASAPKAVATIPVTTTIVAVVDVGFGNTLYVRGEGPGLSWDKGLLMACMAPNQWQITLGESARGYTFKFLINDVTWSIGPDFTAGSGGTVTLTPEF